jgi:hypothetical protein
VRIVELDALMDYALCPMRYWWRHRVGVVAPATMETLPYLAMRQGLSWYYRDEVPKLVGGGGARKRPSVYWSDTGALSMRSWPVSLRVNSRAEMARCTRNRV